MVLCASCVFTLATHQCSLQATVKTWLVRTALDCLTAPWETIHIRYEREFMVVNIVWKRLIVMNLLLSGDRVIFFFYICIQHLVSSNVQGFNTSIVSTVEKQDWTTAEGISCVMFWCPQVLSQSKQQSIQATRSSLKTVADIWPGDDGISCAVMSPLIKIQRVINLSMETPEMAKTAIVVYRDCTAFTN